MLQIEQGLAVVILLRGPQQKRLDKAKNGIRE